jgi:hypothetical protein
MRTFRLPPALAAIPLLAAARLAALPPPLVGWWRFGEAADDPIVLDSAAVSGDGVILSETVLRDPESPSGGALAFVPADGTEEAFGDPEETARVAMPDFAAATLGHAFTVALWIAPDAAPPAGAVAPVLGWADESDPPRGFEVSLGGDLRLRASGVPLGPALEAGAWTHAAFVRDAGGLALYLDGAPVAAGAGAPPAAGDAPLCLGATGPGGGIAPFQGAIADLRVYAAALSPGQVASLAGASAGPDGGGPRTHPGPREDGGPHGPHGPRGPAAGGDGGAGPTRPPDSLPAGAGSALRSSPGPDTDGDGMPDAWESLYGLDPLDPSDAAADPDGDGMSNLREYRLGRDPRAQAAAPPDPLIRLY